MNRILLTRTRGSTATWQYITIRGDAVGDDDYARSDALTTSVVTIVIAVTIAR